MNSNENLATLTFFTNSKYQGFVANRTGNQKEKHLAELRFYRKRILGLTKDLAKIAATNEPTATKKSSSSIEEGDGDGDGDGEDDDGDEEEDGQDDLAKPLLAAYENYAMQLIRYFKMLDTKDILQEKYEQMDLMKANNFADDTDDDRMKDYNDPLLNKRLHVANLDNYVQVKQTTVVKSPIVVPTIVSIDLQTPELKTKGVKKKEKKVLPPTPLPTEPEHNALLVVNEEGSFIDKLLSPPKVVVVVAEAVLEAVADGPKKKNKSKRKKAEPTLPPVQEDEEF